jgi:hypothetical protein
MSDEMHSAPKTIVAIILSLVVPLISQAVFVIALRLTNAGSEWFGYGSILVSVTLGFFFLARRFRRRSVFLAVLFFPVMCWALYFYSYLVGFSLFNLP